MKEIPALEDVIRQVEHLEAHVEPELVLYRLGSITTAIHTRLAFTVGDAPLEYLAVLRWVEAKREEVTVALRGPWTISREAGLSPAEHRAIVASRSAHPDVWYRNDADLKSLVSQLVDPSGNGDESIHNELVRVVRRHAESIADFNAKLGYVKLATSRIAIQSSAVEKAVAPPALARVVSEMNGLLESARAGELHFRGAACEVGHRVEPPEQVMDWRDLELIHTTERKHRINGDSIGLAVWAASERGESVESEVLKWYSKGATAEISRTNAYSHRDRVRGLVRDTPDHASDKLKTLARRLGLVAPG